MGSEVTASCRCGLKANVLIGGGMADFTTTCYFPCLCETCHDVVQVNLLAETPACPICQGSSIVPYDDPRLSGSRGKDNVAEWSVAELGRPLVLTNGTYKCPRCNNKSLRFQGGGHMWD